MYPGRFPTPVVHDELPLRMGNGVHSSADELSIDTSYCLVLLCPMMGHSGLQSSRRSGFNVVRTNSESQVVTPNYVSAGSFTLVDAYGGDVIPFAEDGFVWAAEVSLDVHCPNATRSGTAYRGVIPVNSLLADDLTIADLRQIGESFDPH